MAGQSERVIGIPHSAAVRTLHPVASIEAAHGRGTPQRPWQLNKCVGDSVGTEVGLAVGAKVGKTVGVSVGLCVGADIGDSVGFAVGDAMGAEVGPTVGVRVGPSVGFDVGGSVEQHDELQFARTSESCTASHSMMADEFD
jgi:hypothetical protein